MTEFAAAAAAAAAAKQSKDPGKVACVSVVSGFPAKLDVNNGGSSATSSVAKDIFRCVWCHERYASLAELTQHLKEANHSEAAPHTQGRPRYSNSLKLLQKSSAVQSRLGRLMPAPQANDVRCYVLNFTPAALIHRHASKAALKSEVFRFKMLTKSALSPSNSPVQTQGSRKSPTTSQGRPGPQSEVLNSHHGNPI